MINKCLSRIICVILFFSLSTSQASMISTETFLSQDTVQSHRQRILSIMEKKQVQQKLQEYGVSPSEAKERLASLSDAEVEKLNSKIDELPAGADALGAVLGTALTVFVILLITDFLCWTKVFRFTKCVVVKD